MTDSVNIDVSDFYEGYNVIRFDGGEIILIASRTPSRVAVAQALSTIPKYLGDKRSQPESGHVEAAPVASPVLKSPPEGRTRIDVNGRSVIDTRRMASDEHGAAGLRGLVEIIEKRLRILVLRKVNPLLLLRTHFKNKTIRHDNTSFPSSDMNCNSHPNGGKEPTYAPESTDSNPVQSKPALANTQPNSDKGDKS